MNYLQTGTCSTEGCAVNLSPTTDRRLSLNCSTWYGYVFQGRFLQYLIGSAVVKILKFALLWMENTTYVYKIFSYIFDQWYPTDSHKTKCLVASLFDFGLLWKATCNNAARAPVHTCRRANLILFQFYQTTSISNNLAVL